MKDWFFGLEPRERLLVGGGAVLLVLLMLYLVVWAPVAGKYSSLKENVAGQQETLAWMLEASGQIRALQGSTKGSAAGGLDGRSLLAVVDQSARSGGLGTAIKRIEPDGTKAVKVWLEGVAFDPMIVWLGQLARRYRIEPTIITLEPVGGGRVNARLTLLEPAV
jgi:general secretion pathway protein M